MSKNTKTVLILAVLVVVIAVIPLFLRQGAEFGGSDDAASGVIEELDSNYTVWADPVMEPASGEIESLLFCLQAALGAGVIGYGIGVFVERKRHQEKEGKA